jgi:hypothetical protein
MPRTMTFEVYWRSLPLHDVFGLRPAVSLYDVGLNAPA